jgi:hypothetical protein
VSGTPNWAQDEDPRSAKLREIEHGVEMRLREMAESGELSGLPGEGKPFADRDDASGDRWAAAHVMKNAGVVPEWSELRIEIDARRDALVARVRRHLAWMGSRASQARRLPAERILEAAKATRDTDERVRAELASALGELNELVRRYDLIVPVASLQLVPFTLERLLEDAAREG